MGGSMAERAAISDEAIAILKVLWTQEDPSFQGRYHSFSGMKFSPKPLQKPHIPLWVGGTTPAAIRRAVNRGNGWHALPTSPDDLAPKVQYLKQQAIKAGVDLSAFPISIRLDVDPLGHVRTSAPARYNLRPRPAEVLAETGKFQRLGVTDVIYSIGTRDVDRFRDTMELLASDVVPKLR